jgi:hypothetical protein
MSSELNSAFFEWLNLVYKWFQFLKENNPYIVFSFSLLEFSYIRKKKSDYKFWALITNQNFLSQIELSYN